MNHVHLAFWATLALVPSVPATGSQPSESPQTVPGPASVPPADGASIPAEPAPAEPDTLAQGASPWRLELGMWIWITAVDGDVGIGPNVADVSASFGDILDGSDSIFAFSGRLEAGYDKFGIFVDGFYSDLGVDAAAAPSGQTADVNFETGFIDFGLMYRVGSWQPEGDAAKNARDASVDLYAGARYTTLELTIDPAAQPAASADESWFDPILGVKGVVPIAERWHIAINGDIGGFGASSDFTWSTTALLGYDFNLAGLPTTATAGYRAVGWDFSEDLPSAGDFRWDVIQHGLIFGLSLRF